VQSRYDDISRPEQTPRGGSSCHPFAATRCKRAASRIRAETRCTGPTGCGRTSAGAADFYQTIREFLFQRRPTPAVPMPSIGSPKFGVVLGPFAKTEFFVNAGEGFHSNDARGVTIAESPSDGSTLQSFAVSGQDQRSRDRLADKK